MAQAKAKPPAGSWIDLGDGHKWATTGGCLIRDDIKGSMGKGSNDWRSTDKDALRAAPDGASVRSMLLDWITAANGAILDPKIRPCFDRCYADYLTKQAYAAPTRGADAVAPWLLLNTDAECVAVVMPNDANKVKLSDRTNYVDVYGQSYWPEE